jgi:hypothetical protein
MEWEIMGFGKGLYRRCFVGELRRWMEKGFVEVGRL